MKLFCANCGKQLKLTRKALPGLGTIVDLISYHECSEELTPFHIDPSNILEAHPVEGKDKFVQSLNDLKPPQIIARGNSEGKSLRPSSMTGTDDLRDRRFDQDGKAKSSAPPNILDQIKQQGNSIPSHDLLKEDTTDSEMGN
ncbi:MAG: hypothetical protein IMZ53_06640 [Thermoplasmata archaeon]|nr:hypothetical protein [Thermoplasmata archaeon]